MKHATEWQEFERLVARIERAASPRGSVVKSPDRVRDLTTGRMREVDASIRTKVGTAEILITIECRRRSRRDDDTWIEQLATKRQKIGAAKTIAVSAVGFTDSAIQTARSVGIELRTLSKVSASDIEDWFLANGAVHFCRLFENIRCVVVLYEDSGEPSKYAFWAPSVEEAVLYHERHVSPFAIRDYIPLLELARPDMFKEIPFDGTKVDLEFPIDWELGELLVATTAGKKSVHLTKLVVTCSYQSAVCDTNSGVHHEYKSPNGAVVQHTTFQTQWLGLPVTFEHQSDSSGKHKVSRKFTTKPNDEG